MSLRESINKPLGVVIPALPRDCASGESLHLASSSLMPIRVSTMCLSRSLGVTGGRAAGADAAPGAGADMVVVGLV